MKERHLLGDKSPWYGPCFLLTLHLNLNSCVINSSQIRKNTLKISWYDMPIQKHGGRDVEAYSNELDTATWKWVVWSYWVCLAQLYMPIKNLSINIRYNHRPPPKKKFLITEKDSYMKTIWKECVNTHLCTPSTASSSNTETGDKWITNMCHSKNPLKSGI